MSNRIKSLLVLSAFLSFFLFYTSITNLQPSVIGKIIMIIILVISFIMGFLVDSYKFTYSGDIIRSSGLFPFIKSVNIPVSAVDHIHTEVFTKSSFFDSILKNKNPEKKDNYFSMVMVLNDGSRISLGSYSVYYKHYIKKLEKFIKIY
jgi:hypothetical protein